MNDQERPVHPAEIDFEGWCNRWLIRRAKLSKARREFAPPTPEQLALEMMEALKSDDPADW